MQQQKTATAFRPMPAGFLSIGLILLSQSELQVTYINCCIIIINRQHGGLTLQLYYSSYVGAAYTCPWFPGREQEDLSLFSFLEQAADSAESHRGLYWCNDCKRCGTLCFDLLATVQCNCTHIWKVHIGHSLLSIFPQLNGWLCLAVKKWAISPALASCLTVPNLYFIKTMTHCTLSPLQTPVLLILSSLGLEENK